ncbi:phosphatidylglycerophosphatase A [Thalassotalea sp. PS06]|uniref:phosphatidylglycerophosphatase A family protein n=1 Tax=Thalassotalea sp. PS06 TaxID=2594005 RepID=UPI0011625310|nr:phosphatidylglycerophosphatase A [Thalassotalea sp. PS06]QDP01801.1 phosphatidylglycerophosphatase A [Thalassotalea sp. PS06]
MSTQPLPAHRLFKLSNPIHLLAVGFGSGLAPKAPGTFGTAVAVPLFLLCAQLPLSYLIGLTIIMALAGIYICDKAAKDAGVHDHGAIVWDEIVGFFICMLGISVNWMTLLVGFILFRFFDIVKPWPIRLIDRKVRGGFGIMLDDVIAGLMALLIMHLIF